LLFHVVVVQELAQVNQKTTAGKVGHQARLWEVVDIEGVTRFGSHEGDGLKVSGTFVHNVNAGALFEGDHALFEPLYLLLLRSAKYGDRLTRIRFFFWGRCRLFRRRRFRRRLGRCSRCLSWGRSWSAGDERHTDDDQQTNQPHHSPCHFFSPSLKL